MKTYTKKKLLLPLVAGLALTLSASAVQLSGSFNHHADKVMALELDTEIKSVYNLDEELVMPKAQLSDGTTTVDATEAYLLFPDNTAKSGEDFVLNQAGIYSLVFSAEINGKVVKETKDFYVQDVLYEASSTDSTIEYQEQTFLSNSTKSGLAVDLLKGEQFKYNKPINLKELGADTPLLCLYSENGTQLYGESGSRKMYVQFTYIRLTDCHDPNKFIEIRGRWNDGWFNLQAHQGHQPIAAQTPYPEGYPGSPYGPNDRMVNIGGIRHWITYDTSWGCGVGRSDKSGWKFYFNYETKELDVETGSERKTIVDLDNSDIFDDKLFRDFTSDDVYLSVYGTNYATGLETAHYEITEIAGKELTADNSYIDTKGPDIAVDGYDGSMITVAKDEPFALLPFSSLDANGVKEEKASVFYNYGTTHQTEIFVKNNQFTPKDVGEYVIEYKAKDYFGAESVKIVRLNSVVCANNQSINFSVDKIAEVEAGSVCVLEEPTIDSINGDTYYTVYLVDKATGEKTLIENNTFVSNGVGVFEIVYEYGDKYTEKVYAYEFTSKQSSNVIISQPALPEYIISNYYYTLDKASVTSFGTGSAAKTDAKVYVKEDDGEWSTNPVNLEKFKVSSTSAQKVRFKFVDEASGQFVESKEIKVVNVQNAEKKLAVENYFQGDVSKIADAESVTFSANATSGETKVDFINTLTLTNFKLSFSIPESGKNFESLKITLTDFYDRRNVKEFELVKVNDTSCRIYHGDGFIAVSKKFAGDSFTLTYGGGMMTEESGSSVACENDFTNERLLMSFTFVGMDGQSSVSVRQIGNQQIKSVAGDYVAPQIILNNEFSGFAQMGTVVKIYKAETVDVFSPYIRENLTVSVFEATGEIAKSVDGVLLNGVCADRDYDLLLSKNVVYRVIYGYVDQSENSTNLMSPYESLDVEAPTITFRDIAEAKVVKARVGQTVNLAEYTLKDNCDEEEKLKVIVNILSPSREKIYIKLGETSFTPDRAGTYTVKYMAMDSTGNYSTTFYYLSVK